MLSTRGILSVCAAAVLALSASGETVNVRNLGAVGDGVADDWASIQQALSRAGENGTLTVEVPSGTYLVSKPLSIFSNTRLVLADTATVVMRDASMLGVLRAQHRTAGGGNCPMDATCTHGGYSQIANVTITGGTWYHEAANGGDEYVIQLQHGNNITIENLSCKGNVRHHLNCSGTKDVVVRNVRFLPSDAHPYATPTTEAALGDMRLREAIHLDFISSGTESAYPLDDTPCCDVTVIGCTFDGVVAGVGTHRHYNADGSADPVVRPAQRINVTNCTFNLIRSYAASMYGYSDSSFVGNRVVCNPVLEYAPGVRLNGVGSVRVTDNMITNSASHGIIVESLAGEVLSAQIARNAISSAGAHGIWASGDQVSVALSDNVINGTVSHGIYALGGAAVTSTRDALSAIGDCAFAAVNGDTTLTVAGAAVAGTGSDGVRALNGAGVEARDSVFEGVGQHGVLAQNEASAVVSGCTFDTPAKVGAYFNNPGASLLEYNVFLAAGGSHYGAVVAQNVRADTLQIVGNQIVQAKTHGIYVLSSSGVEIRSNAINGTGTGGIFYNASIGGTIVSNRIENAGSFGIHVTASPESTAAASAAVIDNVVATAASSNSADVDIGAYTDGCTVSGNVCGRSGVKISPSAVNVAYEPVDAEIASLDITSADTANVKWGARVGVSGYCVECAATADFATLVCSGSVDAGVDNYDLSGLSARDRWYVRVRTSHACNGRIYESRGDPAYRKTLYMSGVPEGTYYTVHFDANGGSGEMADQAGFVYGTPKPLNPNRFTNDGYLFAGWSQSPTATTVSYADGASLSEPSPAPAIGGSITLYAVWTPDLTTYAVHFDGNGATSGAMADQRGFVPGKGGRTLRPNQFVRTGYDFLGWAKYPKSTAPLWTDGANFVTSTAAGDTLVLYAVWQLRAGEAYTLKFNANGGSGTMADKTDCIPGVACTLPKCKFTNTGYVFEGWALTARAENAVYPDEGEFSRNAAAGSTLTLYAVWRLDASTTYAVHFDGNGATSGLMDDQVGFVPGKGGRTLKPNRFANVGYVFLGWSKYPKATDPTWTDGAALVTSTPVGSRLVLYAVWRLDESVAYSVAFEANGGTGSMPVQPAFVYGKGRALAPNAFTRDGYVFRGWNRSMYAASATYADGAMVYRPDPQVPVGGTLRLFAVWEPDPLCSTVSFDANGGEGEMADQLGFRPDEARPLAANAFVRPGYVFAGWSKSPDAGPVLFPDGSDFATDESLTLYAIWAVDAACYSVHFEANGGIIGEMPDQLGFVPGKRRTALAYNAFIRPGYKFIGWAKFPLSTTPLWADGEKLATTTTPGETLTLYALWEEAPDTYVIAYDANGGDGAMPMQQGLPYGQTVALLPNAFFRDGFDFVGWSEDPRATEASYVDGDEVSCELPEGMNVPIAVLYAVWRERRGYEVELNKNDGSGQTVSIWLMPDELGQLPRLASSDGLNWARRGFTFLGWSLAANSREIAFYDWECVQGLADEGEKVPLYAVWSLDTGYYALQFIRNDGAGTWRTVGFNYGEKTRMPSLANGLGWARRGYAFRGWELTTAAANDNTRETPWKGDWAYVATPVAAGAMMPAYARWELKPGYYQIRFNKNDGTGKWRTLGFECDKSTKLSTIAGLGWERLGYTFKGWASNKANADAGKVWKPDGEWVKNAAAEGRTLSIYAIWE